MNAAEIVAECEARRIVLTIAERSDALDFDAPPGALTSELRALLAAHKSEVIQVLFEREERAALQDAPEWADAGMWQAGTTHPAALALLDKFAAHGIGLSFVSVTPTRRAESEAVPDDNSPARSFCYACHTSAEHDCPNLPPYPARESEAA